MLPAIYTVVILSEPASRPTLSAFIGPHHHRVSKRWQVLPAIYLSTGTPKTTKNAVGLIIKDSYKGIYDLIGNDEKLLDFSAPQLSEFEKPFEVADERSTYIRVSQEKLIPVRKQLSTLWNLGTVVPLAEELNA
ncbi:hypothetical protein GIV21_25925 [Pseudomonas syringae]|uniref:hypothetical protein n=1 Tax=Pseudomonas syringae TaxID=317 RepID=UPI002FDAA9DB|nr:hypothetical protein [Pseudomonas syringae]